MTPTEIPPSKGLLSGIRRALGGDSLKGARRRTTTVMLAPWVVGFVGFIIGPLIASLIFSFTYYDIFTAPKWAGLSNIREMTNDPNFWNAWRVTLEYGIVGTFLTMVVAFGAALMIYHARMASGFWRVIYYFPALLGGAAEAYVMLAVWTPDYGLVNGALGLIGVNGPGWIASPDWALPAVILMRYWTVGTLMLLLLGGRASVPLEQYEAVTVDGAGRFQQFRFVTIPMMSPILLVSLILGIIGSLQAFSQVYIMTRGGPYGSTELVGIYIYREAFLNIRMGYASAVSWSLFLVTLVITLGVLVSSRRWVHYEEGGDAL